MTKFRDLTFRRFCHVLECSGLNRSSQSMFAARLESWFVLG